MNFIRRNKFCTILNKLQDFNDAQKYFSLKQYQLSDQLYQRCLSIIEISNEVNTPEHIDLLKKMAQNQKLMKQHNKFEIFQEKIIQISKQINNEELLQQGYQNLYLHCLNYNLNKALDLGKQLVEQEKKQNKILFFYATALFLDGQNQKAQDYYNSFLETSYQDQLISFALNNLALVQEQSSEEENFQSALQLYQKSIEKIEQKNISYLFIFDKVQQEIQQNEQKIENLITNDHSGTVLLNIINNRVQIKKQDEATHWMKQTLKFFETNHKEEIYKILIVLAQEAVRNQQYMKAEGLFRNVLETLQNQNSYFEVIAMKSYSEMLQKIKSRVPEGEQMFQKSLDLEKQFTKQQLKLINLLLPSQID